MKTFDDCIDEVKDAGYDVQIVEGATGEPFLIITSEHDETHPIVDSCRIVRVEKAESVEDSTFQLNVQLSYLSVKFPEDSLKRNTVEMMVRWVTVSAAFDRLCRSLFIPSNSKYNPFKKGK